MARDYEDPARYDDFLSVENGLRLYAGLASVPTIKLKRLVEVFAEHELGNIPENYAQLLSRLAGTHKLVLVANIWAPKSRWLAEFERAGVSGVFRETVFSSDFRSIKPSPSLYREALSAFSASPEKALFVGDSLRYDIEGAKALGLTTAWVNEEFYRLGNKHELADVQALSISGQVLQLKRAEQVIVATRNQLESRDRTTRTEWGKAKQTAAKLQDLANKRFRDIAHSLEDQTRDLSS